MIPDPPAPQRLHQLDGLRAVATLLVLAHHSVSPGIQRSLELGGWPVLGRLLFATTGSGVDLFFVLSGVVLLRPYLRGQRRFEAGTYFKRRAERILPPYLGAWLLAGAVTAFAGLRPTWFSEGLQRFSLGGWLAQAGILRFGPWLYNDAWWSLAVEALFYLVVPLVVLLWAARAFSRAAGLAALAACAALSTAVQALSTVDRPPLAMLYSLGVYASCFCGGILIARFELPRWLWAGLAAAGAGWVIASARLPVNGHVGFGLLYTGVVLRLVQGRYVRGALASPLMVWLGERSYSLFLVHVSVFQLVNALAAHVWPGKTAAYFAATRLTGLPLALLAAMALFTAVERRFARGLVTGNQFWPPLRRARARADGTAAPLVRALPAR